jgi:hypothetical protein
MNIFERQIICSYTFKKLDWPTLRRPTSSLLASKRCSVDSMEDLDEGGLSISSRYYVTSGSTVRRTISSLLTTRSFTPTAMYPNSSSELQWIIWLLLIQMRAASPLCEQDTEELIHRIEEATQNLIPLSVPDVIDHAPQLRPLRFHESIAFLCTAKCYQRINSLRCKGIAQPCRS